MSSLKSSYFFTYWKLEFYSLYSILHVFSLWNLVWLRIIGLLRKRETNLKFKRWSLLKVFTTTSACDKGDAALCEGKIDKALDLYTGAINKDKADKVLYLNRAFAYNLKANDNNALRFVNKKKCFDFWKKIIIVMQKMRSKM